MVNVYDRRPMQPDELFGVQFRLERSNALAQQVFLPRGMQTHVVSCCFNPFDVIDRDHRARISILGQEALRVRTVPSGSGRQFAGAG